MIRNIAIATTLLLLTAACVSAGGGVMPGCKESFDRVIAGVFSLGMSEFNGCVPLATGSFKSACLSANRGEAAAQSSVGDRYRRIGVDSDRYPPPSDYAGAYIRAYMWYSLADANGHGYGGTRKRSLAEELNPDQIAEAERLVAGWQPDPNECEANEALPKTAEAVVETSPYGDAGAPSITGTFEQACLSANRGEATAQSSVGDRYRRVGVVSDRYPPPSDYASAYKRAYMWYSLAQANGDGYGAGRKRSLAEEMTPDQIAEAKRLVAGWQSDPGECKATEALPKATEALPKAAEAIPEASAYGGAVAPIITGTFKSACLSANRGEAAAQSSVGDRYRRVGVVSDRYPPPSDYASAFMRAYMWYSLAEANGDGYGAQRRRSLAEEMTPEQIAEAERLVAGWQPNPNECDVT